MTHELNMIDYLDFAEDECTWKFPTAALDRIFRKKKFNKSQPKLGDFVPTNEDGEVMEKPEFNVDVRDYEINTDKGNNDYLDEMNKQSNDHEMYRQALDRVIWKGWEVEELVGYYVLVDKSRTEIAECYTDKKKWTWYDKNTYEKLIDSGVKLERIIKK